MQQTAYLHTWIASSLLHMQTYTGKFYISTVYVPANYNLPGIFETAVFKGYNVADNQLGEEVESEFSTSYNKIVETHELMVEKYATYTAKTQYKMPVEKAGITPQTKIIRVFKIK